MKEILFRAWDKKEKQFVYFELFPGVNNHTPDIYKWAELEDWEQFLGLRDKKGRKIFEGDILGGGNRITQEEVGPFDLDGPVYTIEKVERKVFKIKNDLDNNCGECGWFWGWDMPEDRDRIKQEWEVIGNIHEHPELLK
jgi:uncharacterized phage protein (TIGR01671 family)